MKRIFTIALCILLLLCACAEEKTAPYSIVVSLVETEGCFIPANGQRIQPGQDAVFEMVLEDGYAFFSVDYDGEYEFKVENGKQFLCLKSVRYPTRAVVTVTDQYRTIVYHPNGGTGETFSRDYDITYHQRPNTCNASAPISNPGHTLFCWNTKPDGSGQRVGLGSRVSVHPLEPLTLYAQWMKWSDASAFIWEESDEIIITGYTGTDETLVIPEEINGKPVGVIRAGAFQNCPADTVVLPKTLKVLEAGAFSNCLLSELILFDSIEWISDGSFLNCGNLESVHINSIEPPYGYEFRRESVLADKVDLLIESQGERKLVFYGGCSMWYNLDGQYAQYELGDSYRVINMGLNGVINSAVQMELITQFLEPGDIFFHTPELSSQTQLMTVTEFEEQDRKLWCGLEYNYDLIALLDLREFPGLLDSFRFWLEGKQGSSEYSDDYRDELGRSYLDDTGGIPFHRDRSEPSLADGVWLDPGYLQPESMERLENCYARIQEKGVTVYLSYACVNLDAVPIEQQGNVQKMDHAFSAYIAGMEGVTLISHLEDYIYHNDDFYDTNYHLLTEPAQKNTTLWLRDLRAQMERDGIWEPDK